MHYRERIRALREDNDYTQTQIANILHISQRTYADYELGKTRIPVDSLIKLAEYYDVDMNYISGVSNVIDKFPLKICIFTFVYIKCDKCKKHSNMSIKISNFSKLYSY